MKGSKQIRPQTHHPLLEERLIIQHIITITIPLGHCGMRTVIRIFGPSPPAQLEEDCLER